MADPLRRTLLAKLRGKKSKKGATVGGGYGSVSAAAGGGREGNKEKVLQQTQRSDSAVVTMLTAGLLECTEVAERVSTYENYCVDAGAMVLQTGGVLIVRESLSSDERSPTQGRRTSSGSGVRVNEQLLGVSLQRDVVHFDGGDGCRVGGGRSKQSGQHASAGKITLLSAGLSLSGPHVHQRNHFVSRQCSAGDSIGFGDNSNHVLYRARLEPRTNGPSQPPEGLGVTTRLTADSDGTEGPVDGTVSQHMAGPPVHEHNANRTYDNKQTLEQVSNRSSRNAEENLLIRDVESYGPEFAALQSPAFFPTELEICDINMASLCAREASLRFTLDSEDEDYYDNEILPFYETIRAKGDSEGAAECAGLLPVKPCQDERRGRLGDSSSSNGAQETARLRNQLKDAFYLLINAMNDINRDAQQTTDGLNEERQAASSCSSHSRDSLCSRLSAKNMDSDSWSSGGDHSPQQQVSDTDSLLLCLGGNQESGLGDKTNSKSMVNLSLTETGCSLLLRSASDGAIRYQRGPSLCARAPGTQSPEIGSEKIACSVGMKVMDRAEEVKGVDDSSEAPGLSNGISSDQIQDDEDGGRLNESSGSVSSLTGSSDGNQGPDSKQDLSRVQAQRANSFNNKGHGVTVNKMQEWMHRGRLLSSEMKQRIEGSPLPNSRGQNQNQDRCSPQTSPVGCKAGQGLQATGRGVKPVKATPAIKSPPPLHQQQPAFIENVQTPCAANNGRAGEPPSSWRPPLTTITVSKKRNWLQQSSVGKSHCPRDEPQGLPGAAEDEGSSHQPPPPSPSPSPDHLRPSGGIPTRPARLQLSQVSVGPAKGSSPHPHPRSVDPAEENDADDEGEIWYNPIPEDDEPDASHRRAACVLRLLPVPVAQPSLPRAQQPQRRPPSRGGAGGGRGEGAGARPEAPGESLGEGGSQGNAAAHSTEALHLHRQMLACKTQEEGGGPSTSRATDVPDLPNAVSSPPASPNPAKKSSSINWSFPDKIKSPRTVRKISMRMKKLPELSRKLSIKGMPSSSSSNNNNTGESESTRANSPRNNHGTTGSEAVQHPSGPSQRLATSGGGGGGQASRNVISRYHLDSSVSTQHSFNSKKKSSGGSKSASKGGYLSDGDSPELVAKSGKHGQTEGGKGGKGGKDTEVGVGGGGSTGSGKLGGAELDIDAFRHYSFTEQPKCSQYISGLMSLHFYGAEDLKPPRVDSRDVYCAIQVDSVNKARTALLTCRTAFLDMDHTFNIELENAQHLKLVVFSWEPTPKRNRVCCHGTVVLPALFRVTRSHQLAVKLEPRGLIYVKLSLMEQWQNSLDGGGPDGDREPQVFGVEAWRVVEREGTGLMVPLLIEKCINEIEKRGCQVVGLYRLCGSAAVKKELREAFERDSYGVELCENTYPDVNVITGVLKDYLRELPYPLITTPLYEAVLECMASRPLRIGPGGCENHQADSEHTVSLLDNLPEVERMTLRRLLDHLKLVASYQEANKMTCQNLAVCFGPVLLSQRQEASCHTNRVFIDSEELASALHFKKHIEVLHYLLQLWPVVDPLSRSSSQPPACSLSPAPSDLLSAPPPLRRRKERPQVLNLSEAEMAGVLRPKAGRLDSPSNRYAGDWSRCGESYFPCETLPTPPLPLSKEEADYDDVASEAAEEKPEDAEEEKGQQQAASSDELEQPLREDEPVVEEVEENEGLNEDERRIESDGSGNGHPLEDKVEVEVDEDVVEEDERVCDHILPPRLPKEHTYQAYMKIQDISPVLSNRVNLRDLQESIDTLIGNLERELNKNKLNVGY